MSPDQCPILPGPLMLSESLKTLLSLKALLTLTPYRSSSADRTLKMLGAGGALLPTGGLAEMRPQRPLFVICCCAMAQLPPGQPLALS